jgi:DNA polymerase III epsilon subunit-like protein
MHILVFDTETTGLPKRRDSSVTVPEEFPHIVQLSYIVYDMHADSLLVVSDNIIKLDDAIDIPEDSVKIHKISKEISREKGIPIKDALMQFVKDLRTCSLLVAHNIEFDINMITVELVRLNRLTETEEINEAYALFSGVPKYCTMSENKKLCNILATSKAGKVFVKYPSLTELHMKMFQTVPNYMHNSLNDILICLRCYYYQKTRLDICDKNGEIKELLKYLL